MFFKKTIANIFEVYKNVESWLPSNKPKFKSNLTGNVVTLEKVSPDGTVTYRKNCGTLRTTTKANFYREYRKI